MVKPTRHERRLEKTTHELNEFHGALDPTRKDPVIRVFILIVGILGFIAAMIPMLIGAFFSLGSLYLIYKFFSYF